MVWIKKILLSVGDILQRVLLSFTVNSDLNFTSKDS